jgi:acylphosphatase
VITVVVTTPLAAVWVIVVGDGSPVDVDAAEAAPAPAPRPDVRVAPYVCPGPSTFVASGGASGPPPLAVGVWPETAAAMEAKAVATTTPETASSTPARRPMGGSAGGAVVTGVAGSGSAGSYSGCWDTAHPCLQVPAAMADDLQSVPCGASRYHPLVTMVRVMSASNPEPTDATAPSRITAWVHGRVQGVGFRWWTRSRALEIGLTGSARNMADGRVEVVAEGPRESCERLLESLRSGGAPGTVDHVVERWSQPLGDLSGFVER